MQSGQVGHWLAMRLSASLIKNTRYTVEVMKGAPSAEGPKTTPSSLSYDFSTYPPFTVHHWYPNRPTDPATNWSIYFTNAIDEKTFHNEYILPFTFYFLRLVLFGFHFFVSRFLGFFSFFSR